MTRTLAAALTLAVLAPLTAHAQDARLSALKREPSIGDVQKVALYVYRVNPEAIRSLQRRAAAKNALPQLEVSGSYTDSTLDEDTINQEFSQNEPWIIRGTGGSAWEIKGKLTWDLPKLIFNAEELDVTTLGNLSVRVLREVTRIYYARRRMQLEMILRPPTDQVSRLAKETRLEELTALLDALTGGWFGKELAQRTARANRKKARPAPALPPEPAAARR